MPKPPKPKQKADSRDVKRPTPPAQSSELDPFANFEMELLWCIRQLESSFKSKVTNPRTAEDHMRALSTLKSSKAPLIKKRQVMRTLFGDYRAKMAVEEEKFYKANANLRFLPSSDSKKSQFFKKSSSLISESDQTNGSSFMQTETESTKEDIPCDTALTSDGSEEKNTPQAGKKSFSYKPSNNQFRFNFSSSGDNLCLEPSES